MLLTCYSSSVGHTVVGGSLRAWMFMYADAVGDDSVCVCEEDNSKIQTILDGTIRQTDRQVDLYEQNL